jgi:hypothetical protein
VTVVSGNTSAGATKVTKPLEDVTEDEASPFSLTVGLENVASGIVTVILLEPATKL